MIIMIHLPSCSIAFLTCSLHCTAAAVTRSQHIGILQYLGRRKPSHRLTGRHSSIPASVCDSWSCLRLAAPHHLMIGVSSEQPGPVLCVDTALYQHQTRRPAVSTYSRGSLAPNTGEHCTLQHTAPQSHCPRSPHAAADRDPMVLALGLLQV